MHGHGPNTRPGDGDGYLRVREMAASFNDVGALDARSDRGFMMSLRWGCRLARGCWISAVAYATSATNHWSWGALALGSAGPASCMRQGPFASRA